MIRRLAVIVIGLLSLPALAWAVMSVTATERRFPTVKKVTLVWVSAADGTASGATVGGYDGKLIGMTTIPAAAGAAPTDNYDITLADGDGHDVLLGAGANRDTANTEHVAEASLGAVSASLLTLSVAAAGDTKGGTVVLYIR